MVLVGKLGNKRKQKKKNSAAWKHNPRSESQISFEHSEKILGFDTFVASPGMNGTTGDHLRRSTCHETGGHHHRQHVPSTRSLFAGWTTIQNIKPRKVMFQKWPFCFGTPGTALYCRNKFFSESPPLILWFPPVCLCIAWGTASQCCSAGWTAP